MRGGTGARRTARPGESGTRIASRLNDVAPDFAEPFEAWRVWRVVHADGVFSLASVVKGVEWPAGEPLVAECLGPRLVPVPRLRAHAVPAARCECGIYATDLARASQYLRDSIPFDLGRVLGRVALWGTVVECERGFRASHAYPVALYVPVGHGNGALGRALDVAAGLARYRVPVQLRPRTQPDLAPAA